MIELNDDFQMRLEHAYLHLSWERLSRLDRQVGKLLGGPKSAEKLLKLEEQ